MIDPGGERVSDDSDPRLAAEPGPILTLTGQLVGLGPLDRSFLPQYHRWANDVETSRTLGLSWPASMEQIIATFESRVRAPDAVWFTVVELATGQPIGLAYLFEIEPRQRRATFGIVIGEASDRGRGCGTEATQLTLHYAFELYGLSNVMLTVYASNHAGIRAYEKAGFRVFGRRRACSVVGQELVDLIYMEAVAGDRAEAGNGSAGD